MKLPIDRLRRGPSARAALFAALACAAWLPRVATAESFQLPPIADSANVEHHPGKVIWADLITPDLAASKRFYGGLFGWSFQDIRAGHSAYAVATLGGHPVAGLFEKSIPTGEHRQPAWLTFIAVRNLEQARSEALAHGAKLLAPPKTYAGRGAQAVFTDPQGAVFAALESSSGDGGDYLAAPGEWIWSSLLTDDPAASAAFYKAVFGYEVFDLPRDDDAQQRSSPPTITRAPASIRFRPAIVIRTGSTSSEWRMPAAPPLKRSRSAAASWWNHVRIDRGTAGGGGRSAGRAHRPHGMVGSVHSRRSGAEMSHFSAPGRPLSSRAPPSPFLQRAPSASAGWGTTATTVGAMWEVITSPAATTMAAGAAAITSDRHAAASGARAAIPGGGRSSRGEVITGPAIIRRAAGDRLPRSPAGLDGSRRTQGADGRLEKFRRHLS